MSSNKEFESNLFKIKSKSDFIAFAMQLFAWQSKNNRVYSEFLIRLGTRREKIRTLNDIPFLPIEFFKTKKVISGIGKTALVFKSSGTTSTLPSRHHLLNSRLYENSILRGFEHFYGNINNYSILALIPERERSSLVYMVNYLSAKSGKNKNGFYYSRPEELTSVLKGIEAKKAVPAGRQEKALLIGLASALLDFFRQFPVTLKNVVVMETGGMKGQRKEITRTELHAELKRMTGLNRIHSEYGMTELLSQAWSKGGGEFYCPPWMKILIRQPNDPLSYIQDGRTGGINIIDLANIYSCAFIATGDMGRVNKNGSVEVLGRMDYSDARGCSLMIDGY